MSAFIDTLIRDKTLHLKVLSWQQSVHGVCKSDDGEYPVGQHRISLRCRYFDQLRRSDVLVGVQRNLSDLDFNIQLCSANQIFEGSGALASATAGSQDGLAVGGIVYHGSEVTGAAFFNDNTLWQISRLLTTQVERGVHLLVTVNAATAPTPGWLTYQSETETYRWLGEKGLVVRDVSIVTEEMPPEVPIDPDEHHRENISAAIADAKNALVKTATRMGAYILAMLGAILVELWRLH